MSTQQQQAKVLPSLADLDNPSAIPVVDNPNPPAPVNDPPPPPPVVDQPKNDQPKIDEVKDDKPDDQQTDDTTDEAEDPQAFYDEVAKLRGDGFKFTFPESMDPNSPEGLHHAIATVVDHELTVFEQNLLRDDARAYAYMVHRSNGGSDEEFFSTKTEVLPEWDVLKNSVDLQQAFYRRALSRKEVNPEDIDILVKNAIDKNKLTALVESEYNRLKKLDEDQAREIIRINKENRDRQDQMVQKMGTTLQEKILHSKGIDITIPDAKRGEFLQFMNQMMNLDPQTGRWYIQQEITSDNMNHLIEAMYYLKVGGDLNEIIKKKADEHNTRRLKMSMSKDKTKKTGQPDPQKASNNKPGVLPALTDLE